MTIQWKGREWLIGENWGIAHPNKPMWYSSSCVQQSTDGSLILSTKHLPKEIEGKIYPVAIGLVSCLDDFNRGYYKIVAKLPKFAYAKSAIWLYSKSSWPPEIDIIEAYANKKGSYFAFDICNPLRPFHIEGNFHYTNPITKEHQANGVKRCKLDLNQSFDEFITYEMVWDKDKIVMSANGKVFYELSGTIFHRIESNMRFVLNSGIHTYKDSFCKVVTKPFIIKDFTYIPYK